MFPLYPDTDPPCQAQTAGAQRPRFLSRGELDAVLGRAFKDTLDFLVAGTRRRGVGGNGVPAVSHDFLEARGDGRKPKNALRAVLCAKRASDFVVCRYMLLGGRQTLLILLFFL